MVCRASLGVFKALRKEKLIANAREMGEYLKKRLSELAKKYSVIKDVRGLGLMIGIELNTAGKPVVEECIKRGLLINCTHETVLRLMPALNVTCKQIDKAVKILDMVLANFKPQ